MPPPRPKAADRRARIAVAPGIRAAEKLLEEIAGGDEQIVAGPWLGSLERELLYWIPFLRWFRRRFDVPRARIAAVSRPGADLWYADIAGSYSSTPGTVAGRPLAPPLLEQICGDYWHERGPLVHVLDRLEFARILSPAAVSPRQAVVLWPDGEADTALPWSGEGEGIAVIDPGDREDAAAVTAAIATARMLVGPWSARLVLGPMLGTPTVGLTDGSSASPDLDLAHRAARALESPLLLVDADQAQLVAGLAGKVAG